ncbi:GFA family protein [Solimicrobium silvestre]|uniref:Glutathione-dependent formaldehyde-activating enzyme n=1 Tax=Solimicrobium silvestre TaxID=2099400 RepID=A0A2S9H3V1_9BURK|nr:GFA family protein [Solimicrobium silvestre]PRC94664.1 Glutathione-dependent formaldehyde-activating enzyme [Solimicrobium silvestre]
MITHNLNGQCYCGNIQLEVGLTSAPLAYEPRACDCDFCRKHGASYISDPQGFLRIHVNDEHNFGKYRQGSEVADFLLCRNCGVLVAVTFQSEGQLYATLNSKVIDGEAHFGMEKTASPKMLAENQKTERWKKLWFSNVSICIDKNKQKNN